MEQTFKEHYLQDMELVKFSKGDFSFKYKNIPLLHESFQDMVKFIFDKRWNLKLKPETIQRITMQCYKALCERKRRRKNSSR